MEVFLSEIWNMLSVFPSCVGCFICPFVLLCVLLQLGKTVTKMRQNHEIPRNEQQNSLASTNTNTEGGKKRNQLLRHTCLITPSESKFMFIFIWSTEDNLASFQGTFFISHSCLNESIGWLPRPPKTTWKSQRISEISSGLSKTVCSSGRAQALKPTAHQSNILRQQETPWCWQLFPQNASLNELPVALWASPKKTADQKTSQMTSKGLENGEWGGCVSWLRYTPARLCSKVVSNTANIWNIVRPSEAGSGY